MRLSIIWKIMETEEGLLWRKVFPLENEVQAQQELDAWLSLKLGETRLKWQLSWGQEPSLLRRTGIKPLTCTTVDWTELNFGSNSVYSSADQMAITQAGHGEIISNVMNDAM